MKSILQNVKKRVGGASASGTGPTGGSGSPEAGSPPTPGGSYTSPHAVPQIYLNVGGTASHGPLGGGDGTTDAEGHASFLPHNSLLSLSPTSGAAQCREGGREGG